MLLYNHFGGQWLPLLLLDMVVSREWLRVHNCYVVCMLAGYGPKLYIVMIFFGHCTISSDQS